ncbi:hypothetical protein GCM10009547_09590 [Sporichthya brevicatena]|uniref:NlpC/P60 domain-containing protein n=1 Tax=Sporichthya brevicatena TaxID=171442 RepID=A0ABN1GE43_9ACTN
MSIADVQARMAAITAQFVSPLQTVAVASASTATASGSTATTFAAALAEATASTGATGSTGAGAKATGTAADLIADAKRYLGVPYVWGGTNPDKGVDCSGLTQLVYGHFGIDLPRVSYQQAKEGTPVHGLANAKPGDLLAFDSPVDHVAIYLGDNKMIHAPRPGKVVEISDVYETPTHIRRLLPETAPVSNAATSTLAAALPGGLPMANSLLAQYPALAAALGGSSA